MVEKTFLLGYLLGLALDTNHLEISVDFVVFGLFGWNFN